MHISGAGRWQAGRLRVGRALGVALALLAGGLATAFALSTAGGLCLLAYLLLTSAYTLALKRQLFLDVLVIAGLFAVRLVAGAVAAAVTISAWLVAFSLFLFLSLAIAKRSTALRDEVPALGGRGYVGQDAVALTVLGGASAFAAVVVLALYIQSPVVAALYDRPAALWLACPLLIYWLSRVVLLAKPRRAGRGSDRVRASGSGQLAHGPRAVGRVRPSLAVSADRPIQKRRRLNKRSGIARTASMIKRQMAGE